MNRQALLRHNSTFAPLATEKLSRVVGLTMMEKRLSGRLFLYRDWRGRGHHPRRNSPVAGGDVI